MATRAAVVRLAEQLHLDPDHIRSYGKRANTRTGHLLGWRVPTPLDLKELDEFLLARALEHDGGPAVDRAGVAESKAAHRMRDELAERGKAGEERQALLDAILAIAADPAVSDEGVGGLIRGEKIGWERLRSAQAATLPRLPRDHGHLNDTDGEIDQWPDYHDNPFRPR